MKGFLRQGVSLGADLRRNPGQRRSGNEGRSMTRDLFDPAPAHTCLTWLQWMGCWMTGDDYES